MANKPKEKELGGSRNMSTSTKVIIAIFAVVMALSMMLPSLAAIFASDGGTETQEEAASSEADDVATTEEDATEDSENAEDAEDADDANKKDGDAEDADEVPDNETLQSLAEDNAEEVEKWEKRLESDPSNLAALLNLGQTYMNWGYSATYSSTTDEETAYSKGLLEKAMEYYDRYLALNDSKAVKVDRALCQYYAGDTTEAIEALEKITTDDPEYPLAWVQLGYLYEAQYDTEKASAAYRKAAELDENEEYGVKDYANQRLIALNSTVSTPGDAGDASADDISTGDTSGLQSTLSSDSGVGF